MQTMVPLSTSALLCVTILAGCLQGADLEPLDAVDDAVGTLPIDTGACIQGTGGPPPPLQEKVVGIQPIELIFGGSIRHALTRVLLVPPTHGDLGEPTNASRSGDAYLDATLQGIFSWEPAIDLFIKEYPQFSYLDNVTVQVDIFEGASTDAAGYDVVVGYAETSGPAFRGLAHNFFEPTPEAQAAIEQATGGRVHASNRMILLSLFAYSTRSGQTLPDFPETHEVRGVTMHEFAHTWGLGHSTTWTPGCGADLMNSPYPYVYGDGNAVGDGGERTKPLCITSLDLYGLAQLYRWLPGGTWEASEGNAELPETIQYKEYCTEDLAGVRAKALLDQSRSTELQANLLG